MISIKQSDIDRMKFSSPCLGILFSLHRNIAEREKGTVFVPMFGDSFFTRTRNVHECKKLRQGFRPHVWGSFFHIKNRLKGPLNASERFRPHVWGSFFHDIKECFTSIARASSFRPHVWGSFFHSRPEMPHGVGSLWPFCGGDFQLIGILIIFTL